MTTIGVLALQGDVVEHLRALESAGAHPLAVRRGSELDAVDGLIVPGGESTTIWKLLEIFELASAAARPGQGRDAGVRLLRGHDLAGI